jgi:succinoglycan biosynthesis protein ExoA
MLNPKGHGSTPAPRTGQPAEPRPFAEPPSFSPAARRDPVEIATRRPEGRFAIETPAAAAAVGLHKRVLIVIPTLNEARVIAALVARMLDDDGLADPLVVVADGGSTDGTRDIVREIARRDPRVRLISNPGRLQSAGLNLAALSVGGDRRWLVRADAHADYPKNYASSLIAEGLRTGASSVVVSMLTVGETPFQRAAAAAQNSRLGAGGAPHRVASEGQWVDHGHHALFSLAAFEAAGGYDETFSHNEDAEFDLRLSRQGGRIWLTDKVRIGYHPRRTPAALWRQYFSYGKGRARTALKHYSPLKIRQALPLAVAPAALGAVLSPLYWPLMVPALAWALGSLTFGVVLTVRKGDGATLLAGPVAMIMHLAWSAGFWAQLMTHGGRRSVGDLLAPSRHAAP